MKKFKFTAAIFALLALLATSLSAAGLAGLPIGSEGALKAYALEQVTCGQISLSSSSMLASQNDSTYFNAVGSPGDIVRQFSQCQFRFSTYKTSDPVYVNADLRDDDWNRYFWGFETGQVKVYSSSSYGRFSISYLNMRLVDDVPIKVKGVKFAEIIVRDSDGNILWSEYLNVSDDLIFFPKKYTNQNGEIKLGVTDENGQYLEYIYSLKGSQIPTTSVEGALWAEIENYKEANDAGSAETAEFWVVGNGMVEDINNSSPPVIKVTINKARKVTVAWYLYLKGPGLTSVRQQPTGVWYYKNGAEEEEFLPVNDSCVGTTEVLQPGVYYFYFEYPVYNRVLEPPVYYGGKG